MPSTSFSRWTSERIPRLDELEQVHADLTGPEPGRRWTTSQLNRGYVVALASQFQGYCRDLHSESAALIATQTPARVRALVEGSLTLNRHLDRGNATAGHLGADFGRFGIAFWPSVYARHASNKRRREILDQVVVWRNSIAHESMLSQADQETVAETKPTLTWGRRWRRALNALAGFFDEVLAEELESISGQRPW